MLLHLIKATERECVVELNWTYFGDSCPGEEKGHKQEEEDTPRMYCVGDCGESCSDNTQRSE